jgi:hypothetical protein
LLCGSHSAACFASMSTSSLPGIPSCDGVHWMVMPIPFPRAWLISCITLYVIYCPDEMARCASACIAAWLSVSMVAPVHPSRSCAICIASSSPTSSAEYTEDRVFSHISHLCSACSWAPRCGSHLSLDLAPVSVYEGMPWSFLHAA